MPTVVALQILIAVHRARARSDPVYICYVDESGHSGTRYSPDQPVEVVCGVLTDLTKLTKTQREHLAKLDQLGVPELKANDAYRGRKDWSNIPAPNRDAVFEEMLRWAVDRSCKFVLSPIDTARFYDLKAGGSAIAVRLGYPWEAGVFNVLLGIQIHNCRKPRNKGRTLVICDEQHEHSDRLLNVLEGDLSFTDPYLRYNPKKARVPRLDQIIDVPLFARSHQAVLVQVADWAAYVVQTHLVLSVYSGSEKYEGEAEKIRRWASQIMRVALPVGATCPNKLDPLCTFFRSEVRPGGWRGRPL